MTDKDLVRIRVTVDTGFVGASHIDEVEFSRSEWEAKSDREKDEEMALYVEEMIANLIGGWWEVIDE